MTSCWSCLLLITGMDQPNRALTVNYLTIKQKSSTLIGFISPYNISKEYELDSVCKMSDKMLYCCAKVREWKLNYYWDLDALIFMEFLISETLDSYDAETDAYVGLHYILYLKVVLSWTRAITDEHHLKHYIFLFGNYPWLFIM